MPITAIVIFRNERELLDGCLCAVRALCDQVIGVDMQSSDGSRQVAMIYVDLLLEAPLYPIAEPTRVAAAKFARHDWILLIDPDEHIPRKLADQIRQVMSNVECRMSNVKSDISGLDTSAIRHPPSAMIGAIRLPWWYYFKRKRLDGTIWGGGRSTKRMLVHRRRCNLLPYCNRIVELKDGYTEITIEHDTSGGGENHIRHYWCDSYRKLLRRHLTRYCHTEAAAQVANGQRFSFSYGLIHPLRELYRCLRHYDGWRLGVRGWLLSGIYFLYVLASSWLVLAYQRKGHTAEDSKGAVPTLKQIHLQDEWRKAA
ncbi:MAG: hypothetical protein IT445_04140 [Phycisphaeraceae bacterium]|nr:hypothetical protein [Phycisphaeraceae bacterium]